MPRAAAGKRKYRGLSNIGSIGMGGMRARRPTFMAFPRIISQGY
jgi:hypothetical protein